MIYGSSLLQHKENVPPIPLRYVYGCIGGSTGCNLHLHVGQMFCLPYMSVTVCVSAFCFALHLLQDLLRDMCATYFCEDLWAYRRARARPTVVSGGACFVPSIVVLQWGRAMNSCLAAAIEGFFSGSWIKYHRNTNSSTVVFTLIFVIHIGFGNDHRVPHSYGVDLLYFKHVRSLGKLKR